MTIPVLFDIAQTVAVIGWALLIFTPRWKSSQFLVKRLAVPFLLGLLYAYLLITNIFGSEGGFSSLEEIKKLFSNDALLLAGWVHYLAFDLLVGTWILKHSQKENIHHLWVVPCLLLTFMAGPVGVLIYVAIYGIKFNKWPVLE